MPPIGEKNKGDDHYLAQPYGALPCKPKEADTDCTGSLRSACRILRALIMTSLVGTSHHARPRRLTGEGKGGNIKLQS